MTKSLDIGYLKGTFRTQLHTAVAGDTLITDAELWF